jgi:hypothetical protein
MVALSFSRVQLVILWIFIYPNNKFYLFRIFQVAIYQPFLPIYQPFPGIYRPAPATYQPFPRNYQHSTHNSPPIKHKKGVDHLDQLPH